MSTIPAKQTERNCRAPWAQSPMRWRRSRPLHLGRQNVRVKLCARSPRTPRDMGGHYNPEGILHVSAKCDSQRRLRANHYPREAHRRHQCAMVLDISGTEHPSVARSATESLALSVATPAGPRSAQKNALTALCVASKTTADGYAGFKMPDTGRGRTPARSSRRFALLSGELVQ
jgi:hypothetical protein